MIFQADELSAKQHYKFLSGAIIPRPIAFVTTLMEDGQTVNAAPFSFFNIVSSDPPIISVSVQRAAGKQKDTARHAIRQQEMMVHIVSGDFISEVNETAARLGPSESEIERTNLTLLHLPDFATPVISEAQIILPSKLVQVIEIRNDAGEVTADLLLARVQAYMFDEAVFDSKKEYLLTDVLQPVSRLAGNDYAKLGETFTLKRP
ncbi:flavin reductase family protein [Listeria costaricensis]|uniref:flavin reductase family protein n=1 Tax=Listeria costaricensis TaxID=2026604 RepID=UPI000C06A9B1|nr:flavin reductase family protein [Listeria costaricensis]